MADIILRKGEGRTLRDGGCWIYDNEIKDTRGEYQNGDIVTVYSESGFFLGRGYINDNSKIRIRILSRNENELIDEEFFKRRIRSAFAYRKACMDISSCRLVYSDADRLPGLIVDKFNDILVVEIDTLGMDVRKAMIASSLLAVMKEEGIIIKGIYERSDTRVRTLEGLERVKGFIGEEFPTDVLIDEYGVKIMVDVADGQKTGYFLDQKANHNAIRKICEGKKVLDCFTHTGGFALSAAKVAKEVIGVDASERAIEQARLNASLNGFANISFLTADVFDYLPKLEEEKASFDVIILDPPAFTKSANSIKAASKGYREINMRAMKLIKDGGFLVTCSCSEYMNRDLFAKIILEAGNSVHKRLRLVEERYQDKDHPIVLGNNVSSYLKCMIIQINNR